MLAKIKYYLFINKKIKKFFSLLTYKYVFYLLIQFNKIKADVIFKIKHSKFNR
jgi:hypothetical protein